MDINDISVKTIENQSFSLHENPERAITALEEDGCVLLKGATSLDACKEAMNSCYRERGDERCRNEHGALGIQSIMAGITREVTLNEVNIISSPQDKADTFDRLSRTFFLTNTSHFWSLHRWQWSTGHSSFLLKGCKGQMELFRTLEKAGLYLLTAHILEEIQAWRGASQLYWAHIKTHVLRL